MKNEKDEEIDDLKKQKISPYQSSYGRNDNNSYKNQQQQQYQQQQQQQQ